jgi:hypothetical protein
LKKYYVLNFYRNILPVLAGCGLYYLKLWHSDLEKATPEQYLSLNS